MIKLVAAAGAVALMAVLAACGSADTTAASLPAKSAPTTVATHPAATTTMPAPAARLTIKQAKAAYVRLADPYNAAVDAVSRDVTDAAPFSRYLADNTGQIKATREFMAGLRATRWPVRAQRYVTAMLLTDMADELGCDKAYGKALSYSDLDTVSATNQHCIAVSSGSDTNANMIRSLLGLPSVG